MENKEIFTHEPTSVVLLEEIRKKVPEFITGKRLNHTFFVEKEAIAIAKSIFLVYNISDRYLNDIKAAALLHDLTKQMDIESQLSLCEKYGIDTGISPSNAILHGKTAAHLAKELFEINDAVFSAIYNHTTGCENMTVFDKIVFLADYTEESRTHENCVKTREFFHTSVTEAPQNADIILDKAIVMSIDGTLSHLIQMGSDIDINTVLARNYLINSNKQTTV